MTTRHLIFMAMEAIWIAALLAVLGASLPTAEPPAVAAALAYPISYAAARLIARHAALMRRELLLSCVLFVLLAAAGGVAAGLPELLSARDKLELPEEPLVQLCAGAAMLGALAWFRGWSLAFREIDIAVFAQGFQIGLVMLFGALALSSGLDLTLSSRVLLAVGFICLGLFGLWHIRSGDTGRGAVDPFAALAGIAAVLVLGGMLWALLDRSVLEAVIQAAQWMMAIFMRGLTALLSLLPNPEPVPPSEPPLPPDLPQPQLPQEPALTPGDWVRTIAAIVFFGVWAVLAVVALLRNLPTFLRWLRRPRRTRGVVRGRSGSGFADTMQALWQALCGWIGEALARIFSRIGNWWEVRAGRGTVEGQYRQFLARLAGRGWTRGPGETPRAFRRRIARLWPDSNADLAALTEAFVTERYGFGGSDPAQSGAAWKRLRKTIWKVRIRDEQH